LAGIHLVVDYHIPSLTVLETCQFSFNCQSNVEEAARRIAEFGQVGFGLVAGSALMQTYPMVSRAGALRTVGSDALMPPAD
jgi:hypothetical protein